ncbi:MAG: GH36-type glycosyl hydrolase domain-containing protein [Terrimicrobiaceae bacterium]
MNDSESTQAFGSFSENGREFVFTQFDTPRPWINYAWNSQMLVSVDQRGRGYSLYRDIEGHRTIPIRDRLVFLKDLDSGRIWTAGWDPVQMPFEHYHCRHGLGYTVLGCSFDGIRCEFHVTAAVDYPAEIWSITVTNTSNAPRRIVVYPAVEFDLGGWTPYGTVENYSVCRMVGDRLLLALNQSSERPGARNHAWFSASRTPDHFETRKREFVGGPYASLSAPAGVKSHRLTDTGAAAEDFIGAFQYGLELKAGEDWAGEFAAGVCFDEAEALSFADRTNAATFARGMHAAMQRTASFDRSEVELPDPVWTRFFNIWAKQQLSFLGDFTRVYLTGFRDTLQDAQALCAYAPDQVRRSIIATLQHQYCDGSTMRGWCPDDHHKYADGGVWLAATIGEYLRETGDTDFLREQVAYRDEGSATVWEHLLRALDWFRKNLGSHGLPKMHFGDWNDSLNIGREGRGESVWLGMALVAALKETASIADQIAEYTIAQTCRTDAKTLETNLEKHAWDGEWYLRGFADDGSSVGGKADAEGTIFAEPQSWAILAGLNPEHWELLTKSVDHRLRTSYGLLVCHPPFTSHQKRLGRISTMPPGWGENGSSYCHVTGFQFVADCLRRDGNAALTSLASILPFNPALTPSESWLEPYAFTNMFRGPHHPRPGATFKGWTTGTVPWALRGLTHYLLGVRPEFDGLRIDPVFPSSWKTARLRRVFRDKVFEIQIINHATEASEFETRLTVNGRPHTGTLIALDEVGDGICQILAEICPINSFHEKRPTEQNSSDPHLELQPIYG